MNEYVERAGNGARCALPPLSWPTWSLWAIVGVDWRSSRGSIAAATRTPGKYHRRRGVEVIPDAIVGIYGDKKDCAARPPAEIGDPEERVDKDANFPISHTRPLIRLEVPDVKGATKAGRSSRLARNRKFRAANKVEEEDTTERMRRLAAERSQRRRQEGARGKMLRRDHRGVARGVPAG